MIKELGNRPASRIARCGSILLNDIRGATTVADMDADFVHQQNIVKDHGHFSSLVVLHTATMGSPQNDVKERAAEQARQMGDKNIATAIVLHGTGIAATVMRTVLVGYFLMTKAGNKQKAFGTIEEAVEWLKSLPGQDAEAKKFDAAEAKKWFNLDGAAKKAA
ncbi:MAG: hypothetical protein QM817_19290 [Archangium sp.]